VFGRGARTKRSKLATVNKFVERAIDEKFKRYSTSLCIDESQDLARVLERGISNYWLLEFKRLKENYQSMNLFFV